MPIPAPTFDGRSYREILGEALARVPAHLPSWTHLNDSDPGVTLLQLFAFMTESLIYRANLIPERNRRSFLRLLGIPVQAAQAAQGFVVFDNPRGALDAVTLAPGVEVRAGKVPFRTENGLEVLPVEGRLYYKSPLPEHRRAEVEALYRRLYASLAAEQGELELYETRTYAPPESGTSLSEIDLGEETVDGAAWLALLARDRDDPAEVREVLAHRLLSVGVLPSLGDEGCGLLPGGVTPAAPAGRLVFELPDLNSPSPRYRRLTARAHDDPLAGPARIELVLPGAEELGYWDDLPELEAGAGAYPPSLVNTDDQERLVTWIRVRAVAAGAGDTASRQVRLRLHWLGVNAARVLQRARVAAERLPDGTGEPDQTATLSQTPVLLDSIRLTVGGELWDRVEDLAAAPPEVPPNDRRPGVTLPRGDGDCRHLPAFAPALEPERRPGGAGREPASPRVFTADRESGEIRFGDGAHGARPPAGATVQASYDYGGGTRGLVGIGGIARGPELPAGLVVRNPIPTFRAADGESVAEAERTIPAVLRHRERLVSHDDFLDIVWRTPGIDLGRVEVLPLLHPELTAQVSQGVVTVVVLPLRDPEHPAAPRPDRLFLETVCRHLEPRRIVTTELYVVGPSYVPIHLAVGIDLVPGHDAVAIRSAVEESLRSFLSPLTGGFDQSGWPLGKAVEALELSAAATRVPGVAKIVSLRLGDDAGAEVPRVALGVLQLPELRQVVAELGDAPTLDEIVGAEDTAGPSRVPVPIVPEEC